MPILVGTSGSAAELPFSVYDDDNEPQLAYSFSTGDVRIRLPGGLLADADVGNVVECGNGQYVLQLTAPQTADEGAVLILFDDGVNRPYVGYEMVADSTDELLEIPFSIYDEDMVGQAGYSFSLGDLQIRLPGETSYSDAEVANIEDLGSGQYVLVLSVDERADPGAIFLHFEDGVNRTFDTYELNAEETEGDGGGVDPVEEDSPSPIPVPNPAGGTVEYVSHYQAAVDRLCEYSKQDVLDG